jgi:hypothetical protein
LDVIKRKGEKRNLIEMLFFPNNKKHHLVAEEGTFLVLPEGLSEIVLSFFKTIFRLSMYINFLKVASANRRSKHREAS